MKSVTPLRRDNSRRAAESSGENRTDSSSPSKLCSAGRGESVGSSRTVGAPSSWCRQ